MLAVRKKSQRRTAAKRSSAASTESTFRPVGMLDKNGPRLSRTTARDPERTRERLLQAAFQLMHRSGFRSTDLDAILARAGVTKGALYHHFANKEALGYAVVDEVIANLTFERWVRPLQDAKNPIDALVRIVQDMSMKPKDLQRGCPLNNLSQEMSPIDAGFRRKTAKVFKVWHEAIAVALRGGQKRGVVRSDVNADETATFLIAAVEGYVSLAKNSQSTRMLQSGKLSVSRHLESLRPARRRARAAGRE